MAYIACDLSDRQTLRDYGRACAARQAQAAANAETRVQRAARGLRLRHGALRRGRLSPRTA
jgi:hypothetical protein